MTTYDLRIEGMSCQHCVHAVERALTRVPGVSKVQVEIGKAHVESAPTVTKDALVQALAAEDYRAS